MRIDDLLSLDMRLNGSQEKLQTALHNIPIFERMYAQDEKVNIEDIEKLIEKLKDKYNLGTTYIYVLPKKIEAKVPREYRTCAFYSTTLCDNDIATINGWKKTAYGLTIYELFAKLCIYMYAYSRKKDGMK